MKNFTPHQYPPSSPNKLFNASGFRNLKKGQLGGVIFGCKNDTIKECLLKQLFGKFHDYSLHGYLVLFFHLMLLRRTCMLTMCYKIIIKHAYDF